MGPKFLKAIEKAAKVESDMSLKSMMVVPPDEGVGGLARTLSGFFADGRARGRSVLATAVLVHRGLSAKVVEFSVNYGVMGVASVYVYAAATRLLGPASGDGA